MTTCTGTPNNSFNVFAPGDHDFNRGYIGNKAALAATGVTARLYFNELTLNNAQINVGGARKICSSTSRAPSTWWAGSFQ